MGRLVGDTREDRPRGEQRRARRAARALLRALALGLAITAHVAPVAAQGGQAPADTERPADTEQAASETSDARCPPSGPPGKKIFYGEAAPGQTSTVAIHFRDRGRDSVCTGVVITERHVLTAGHCACGSDYRLVFGPRADEDGAVAIPIARPRVLDGYDCRRSGADQPGRDLALVTFDPVLLGSPEQRAERYTIAPITPPAIARRMSLDPGGQLKAVGYGLTETGGINEKRAASIPVLSWDCAERFATVRGCQPFTELMLSELAQTALRPGGRYRDTCGGDSGGPVFAVSMEGDACGRPARRGYLVAITSRGMRLLRSEPDKPCGGGGIYEVVARRSVLDWLARNGAVVDVRREVPRLPD